MNKTQVKHLLNVARALRDAHAAKSKFDMGAFVFGHLGAISSDFDYSTNQYVTCNREKEFCGTPACALGHYAARTDLQRLLKIEYRKKHGVPYAQLNWFGAKRNNNGGMACPDYDHEKFQQHFGLNYHEMEELFGGDGCGGATTALQAAKYIERFVKQKQFPGRVNRNQIW